MNAGSVHARKHGRHRVQNVGFRTWLVPPTGYSASVGRVGALAVALGIGAAVVSWPGMPVAYADTPAGDQENDAPPGGDDDGDDAGGGVTQPDISGVEDVGEEQGSPARATTPRHRPFLFDFTRGLLVGRPPVEAPASPPAGEQQSTEPRQPTTRPFLRPRGLRGSTTEDTPSGTLSSAGTLPNLTNLPNLRRLTHAAAAGPNPGQTISSVISTAQGAPVVPAAAMSALGLTPPPVARQAQRPAPALVTVGALGRVLSLFGTVPSPGAPNLPPSPALWTILGFVRREFGHGFANHSPVGAPTQNGPSVGGIVTGRVGPTADVDGDKLTYSLAQGPSQGTVVVNPGGGYTYIANPGLKASGGPDSFVVAVSDGPGNPPHVHGLPGLIHDLVGIVSPDLAERLYPGGGDTTLVTVNVVVTAVPTAPVNAAPVVTSLGTPKVEAGTGVVTAKIVATDPNNDTLHYAVKTQGRYGDVTVDEARAPTSTRPAPTPASPSR